RVTPSARSRPRAGSRSMSSTHRPVTTWLSSYAMACATRSVSDTSADNQAVVQHASSALRGGGGGCDTTAEPTVAAALIAVGSGGAQLRRHRPVAADQGAATGGGRRARHGAGRGAVRLGRRNRRLRQAGREPA